jgi:hypothetical protein
MKIPAGLLNGGLGVFCGLNNCEFTILSANFKLEGNFPSPLKFKMIA